MTHRVDLPRPANDVAGAMGELLYAEALRERVDLGDMRTVLGRLAEAGWDAADVAGFAEAAVEYARARLQRRNRLRDSLRGTGDLAIILLLAAALAVGGARPAEAAGPAAGLSVPIGSTLLDLAIVLLGALGVWAAYGLRRRPVRPDEDVAYGDTTLFGEREP